MRKKLVMLVVLGLVVLCSFARAERIVLNVDEDRKQMEMYGYSVGTFASLTTSNSNSFKLDTTCYQLVVQTNTVLWGTKQNTITFDSWTLRIGEVKRQIDNARVPGLRTEIIADCVNGDTVNLYLRLFVLGNTASIQIIPKAETGAETVLGLTGGYTIVYATPPNFAPTVGGSPVSSANPMPVSGISITSQSDTNVYVTNFPTDYKQSNTDVLIVGSLPAGTNSIGDIGTVSTVSSLTTGTVDIGKVDEISNITSVDLVDLITRITALESATIKYLPADVIAGMTTLPAGTNKIGSLSDTAIAIPDGVNATLTDTAFTGKLPADIKPFVFAFYDTSTAGTVTFTGVLKNIGITSAGAVTDSATIFINDVQYDCLLGGEDSGEGLEGYLLNPEIRWELYGVDRIRIKMSGYQN